MVYHMNNASTSFPPDHEPVVTNVPFTCYTKAIILYLFFSFLFKQSELDLLSHKSEYRRLLLGRIMNILRAVFLTTVLAFTLVSLVCIYRAIFIFSKPTAPLECASDSSHRAINESTRPGLIDRFRQAIRFKTITTGTRQYDRQMLEEFINFLTLSKFHQSFHHHVS